VRVFILSRHGESTLNVERRVNGDWSVPVGLTDVGREAARKLGEQIANMPVEVAVHTRFSRTRETAERAAPGVPLVEEPLLDDIDVGELEGVTIDEYRAWKRVHERHEPFPGGESLDAGARRYAQAFRALVERPESCILVVCHEIPVRYALNAAAGSDELDGPVHDVLNATPYLFDEVSLLRAADRIDELAG
jgi:ribonuclease H / adenosylcobalamin/alpha-ribazole phosphatase